MRNTGREFPHLRQERAAHVLGQHRRGSGRVRFITTERPAADATETFVWCLLFTWCYRELGCISYLIASPWEALFPFHRWGN